MCSLDFACCSTSWRCLAASMRGPVPRWQSCCSSRTSAWPPLASAKGSCLCVGVGEGAAELMLLGVCGLVAAMDALARPRRARSRRSGRSRARSPSRGPALVLRALFKSPAQQAALASLAASELFVCDLMISGGFVEQCAQACKSILSQRAVQSHCSWCWSSPSIQGRGC